MATRSQDIAYAQSQLILAKVLSACMESRWEWQKEELEKKTQRTNKGKSSRRYVEVDDEDAGKQPKKKTKTSSGHRRQRSSDMDDGAYSGSGSE